MACLDAKSISNCFSYFNGIHYFLVDMGFCATNMKFFFFGGRGVVLVIGTSTIDSN